MHGPPETQTGRGMLFFSAVTLILALWMSLGNGDWRGAGLWYALTGFFVCYGSLMAGAAERWHRVVLVVLLVCGAIAFGYAVWLAGVFR